MSIPEPRPTIEQVGSMQPPVPSYPPPAATSFYNARNTCPTENYSLPDLPPSSTEKPPTEAPVPHGEENTPQPQTETRSSSPEIEVCDLSLKKDSEKEKPEKAIEFTKGPSKHPFLEDFSNGARPKNPRRHHIPERANLTTSTPIPLSMILPRQQLSNLQRQEKIPLQKMIQHKNHKHN